MANNFLSNIGANSALLSFRPVFGSGKNQPAATVEENENVIVWGKGDADLKQAQWGFTFEVKDEDQKETERTYDKVRIKDPDNEDNHIDVEVMTAYKLRNSIGKTRTAIQLDRMKPSQDVEILERGLTRTSSV